MRCSNLLEDKQKRLRLNSGCTHPLLCGITTLPAWDTAKKRTTWVKLLQVVYLWSLILPHSQCVFLGVEACMSLFLFTVCDLPVSPRAESTWKARQARQHPGIMRTPSDGMKSSCKTTHAAMTIPHWAKSSTFCFRLKQSTREEHRVGRIGELSLRSCVYCFEMINIVPGILVLFLASIFIPGFPKTWHSESLLRATWQDRSPSHVWQILETRKQLTTLSEGIKVILPVTAILLFLHLEAIHTKPIVIMLSRLLNLKFTGYLIYRHNDFDIRDSLWKNSSK